MDLFLSYQEMGLGRSWDLGPLGEKEAYISGPLVREIGANRGDWVSLTIDIQALAGVSLLLLSISHIAC